MEAAEETRQKDFVKRDLEENLLNEGLAEDLEDLTEKFEEVVIESHVMNLNKIRKIFIFLSIVAVGVVRRRCIEYNFTTRYRYKCYRTRL